MADSFDVTTCNFSISTEPHDTYYPQLEHIFINVNTPEIPDLASVEVLRIHRLFCGDKFLVMMDEDEEELAQFSRTLFDKFGRFRKELMQNEYHKGSGAWGNEMNSGVLLYISHIRVNPAYLRKGIGSWVLQKFFHSEHVSEHDILICWPASEVQGEGNTLEERKQSTEQLDKGIVSFFRKNGFRRIGLTVFFGLTQQEGHRSHSLSVTEDPDIPIRPANPRVGMNYFLDPTWMAKIEQQQTEFPLHTAIFNDLNEDIVEVIRSSYRRDPNSIHLRDPGGNMPIAVAAFRGNYFAVNVLLELGVEEDLSDRDNSDSLTPLERCERTLRDSREFSETLLGMWEGYDENVLKTKAALLRAAGMDVGTDEEFIKRTKWGCTCGQCADGWLSTRMRHSLKAAAESSYELVRGALEENKGSLTSFEEFTSFDFIPLAERPRYNNAAACWRFTDDFKCVQEKLSDPNARPTLFPNPFGSPTFPYALDYIISTAKDLSPIADGSWSEHGEYFEYANLPVCDNDFDYELVRNKIGLPAHIRGPYYNGSRDMVEEMGLSDDSYSD